MEDKGTAPQRTLRRDFECNRLEEQLWTTAYEQIWPVIRKSVKRSAGPGQRAQEPTIETYIARRA
jgi:hypothetical protein